MRNDWDMTFVDSGAKALAFLAKTPVDVVVSDMRMPAMNGAQLLGEVMQQFPKTVHLILSGHMLLSDIKTNDDVLIVTAGTRISPLLLERLKNFATVSGLKEPIYIES